jgi:transitional endoplasmic reticulum ATPase
MSKTKTSGKYGKGFVASLLRPVKKAEPKKYTSITVARHSEGRIILPDGMSFDDAIIWMDKKKKEEQTDVVFDRTFPFHPNEGAVAMTNVLKEYFGYIDMVAHETFFGKIKPELRPVRIGPGPSDFTTAIFKKFQLPEVHGWLWGTEIRMKADNPEEEWDADRPNEPYILCFKLYAEVWKRDIEKLEFIADMISERVKTNSIYRGKAIDSDRGFLDLAGVNAEDLIFGPKISAQVSANIFTPIEKTERVLKAGIPLKSGVLLEGPYGCGKTLTAYVTAKKAVDNGWTFILCKKGNIAETFSFARQYEPCVVFMEDIDAEVGGDERTEGINKVLNVMDGILSKEANVMTILTTNHVEKISRAMLRPGRLDVLIHVGYPEPDAVLALIRRYGKSLITESEDLSDAVKACEGMIPATIREVVERAKRHAIDRSDEDEVKIKSSDLAMAAADMRPHMELLNRKAEDKKEVEVLARYTVKDGGKTKEVKTDE